MGEPSGQVTVLLPRALAEHAGGARVLTLDVDEDMSLATVLDLLRQTAPAVGRRVQDETGAIRGFVNVFVGEDECRTLDGLATPVPPGSTLFIIGSVAGG